MANEFVTIDSVMNLAEAMGKLDGDADRLREIVTTFMGSGPAQLAALADRVAAVEMSDVAARARGLQGAAADFCARKFAASARKLEQLARGGSLDGAPALLEALKADFAELDELVRLINWNEVAKNWKR